MPIETAVGLIGPVAFISRARGSLGTLPVAAEGPTPAVARGTDGWAAVAVAAVACSSSLREQVATLRGSSDYVSAVTFSPDGKLVAAGSGSLDGAVRVWRASTGARVAVMKGHTGDILDVAFSPDSEVLATAATDDAARLWEVPSGESVGSLTGHTGAVNAVGFNRDGTAVITASSDGTVRFWDATSGLPTATLLGARRQDFSSSLGRDDELFLTRGPDNTVRLIDTETLELGDCEIAIRVEQGKNGKTVSLESPKELMQNLNWAKQLKDFSETAHLLEVK